MRIRKNHIMAFILAASLTANLLYVCSYSDDKEGNPLVEEAAILTANTSEKTTDETTPIQVESLVINNYYYGYDFGVNDSEDEIPFETRTLYTTARVNARANACSNSGVVKTLPIGSAYTVVDECDGWYKIKLDDSYAYVSINYMADVKPVIKISATCYYNEYNIPSANGRELGMGKYLAGMVEWLGRDVKVYRVNEDGSRGELIGVYKFDDTGYGSESGIGESKILEGKTIGTIENGTCIDVYMDTYEDCCTWGRQDVYIEFL